MKTLKGKLQPFTFLERNDLLTQPRPVFGGINEDFSEEGKWVLIVGVKGIGQTQRKHGSSREVQLAQATYNTEGKERSSNSD